MGHLFFAHLFEYIFAFFAWDMCFVFQKPMYCYKQQNVSKWDAFLAFIINFCTWVEMQIYNNFAKILCFE